TIEKHDGLRMVRLGLKYVKGLREQSARAILAARAEAPFCSIQDFVNRVRGLRKDELRKLSLVGALNTIENTHRRASLWTSAVAIQPAGPLFETNEPQAPNNALHPMTDSERLNTDFRGTHLTIGRHPMSFHRDRLNELNVIPANRLLSVPNGRIIRIAGCVICRQRPGTAKGLVFLSLEDETGISNAVLMPDVFDRERANLLDNSYLMIEGEMQNIHGVTSVKAARVVPLHVAEEAVPSHDFH